MSVIKIFVHHKICICLFFFLIFQALSHYGGIDILVCNAGMNAAFGSMLEVSGVNSFLAPLLSN